MPLSLGPVVVGKCYAESGVAHPIHKTQALSSGQSLAKMVFEQHATTRYAVRFAKQYCGVARVMEDVRKDHGIV